MCIGGAKTDVAQNDLKPIRTTEEAKKRGRNGGIKSGEVRRAKKNMREVAKTLMSMEVAGDRNKQNLEMFGIPKDDQNYQTAVVVRLLQKALVDGDTSSIRLLGELTGDLNKFGFLQEQVDENVVDVPYPIINIPDNGRDKVKEHCISPQAGPQTMFMASKADIVIYGGAAGGGKAMPLDELVLTKKGYVKNGSLKIGDMVCTPDGKESEIIGIFPQGKVPVFKVKFIDGSETRCTLDHLWHTKKSKDRKDKWKDRTTSEVIKLMKQGHNVLIPLCEPVHFESRGELKIKPYTLGAILGDGSTTIFPVKITKPDKELFYNIEQEGYETVEYAAKNRAFTKAIKMSKDEREWLRHNRLNVKSYDKYIPEEYKYASVEDRFSLIQGLMDTDGYVDERGHCSFCTTSYALAKDFQWIIWSLGGKATITTKSPRYSDKYGKKVNGRIAYEVYIQSNDNSKFVRLKRKKCRCKKYNGGHGIVSRRILSIKSCGYDYCQCIKIADEKGLYITRDFIVTHNTHALLLEALRHKDVKGFGGIIFRKNYTQITAEGGLWDASHKLFSQVKNAESKKTPKLHWRFEGGGKLSFAHLEREEDLKSWQGTEIAYIAFDELTHFTKRQFLYMLSRNRTTCGVKPYVRATCNPDVDSWVADFISWWINQETGYPIPERSGQVRYMCVLNDTIYWADNSEELTEKYDVSPEECKTVTFIASRLEDNKILMESDPGYLANLKAMTEVDMERLLYGNWKIKASAGSFFKRTQIGEFLVKAPDDLVAVCRAWDLAATDKDENDNAAYTAGVLMGKRKNGRFVILDVINQQLKAGDVRVLVSQTAMIDKVKHPNVRVRLPQDPGQAGKEQAQSYMTMLAGYDVVIKPESGDKATRAEPMAAQWQHGNFDIVVGEWNEEYFNQLESFPDSKFKDMVDASSSAFGEITLGMGFNIDNML